MESEVSKSREDREIMPAPASESKRRKTDHTPSRRTLSSAAVERERVSASTKGSTLPVSSGSEFRIQQAKNFAVAQAQQEGCTGVWGRGSVRASSTLPSNQVVFISTSSIASN